MSIAEKEQIMSANNVTIAENQQKVYDAGILKMWDMMTNNGKRTTCSRMFNETNFSEIETLPYPIKATNLISQMFYNYGGSVLPRPQYVDLSMPNFPENNNSNHTLQLCAAWGQSKTKHGVFPDYGIPASNFCGAWFNQSTALETIEILRVHKATTFSNTFTQTTNLKNIAFEGIIGQDINFQHSPLSVDSMKNVIAHLYNYSEESPNSHSVIFNGDCWANLEASGKPFDDGLTDDETMTWQYYVTEILGWNV